MEFKPGRTVGIDLGTTYSTLAYLNEKGDPVPVENEDDDVETPSLILLAGGRHVVVGPNRTRAAMEDPVNVVERVKRFMGSPEFKRTFDGQEITPEFLSALILKKLRQDAEKRIGPIANAVITVPYYFNDAKRKATEDAGRIAGLNVIDIINEPTAATLTYAWDQKQLGSGDGSRPRQALVYDLGGGTFDVTVVRYTPTRFTVLATDGDAQLGGVDWNDRLLNFVSDQYQERYGSDPRTSSQTVQFLRNECDLAKITLSEKTQTTITFRHDDKSISVPMAREQFEELTGDLLQRTADTTELVLDQAGITAQQLDAVVLVGGSTLMPAVQRMIEQITGKKPFRGISPHTAVAQGAAIHAAIIEAKFRTGQSELADIVRKRLSGIQQEEVNSHGLGVIATNPASGKKVNHVMIPRNTQLPAEKKSIFKTLTDNQQRITVSVTEGDAPDPAAVTLIGNCRITNLPRLKKGSPVEVTYAFSKNGRVRVSARETTGGNEAQIEIERRGGLDDRDIDAYTRLASEYTIE